MNENEAELAKVATKAALTAVREAGLAAPQLYLIILFVIASLIAVLVVVVIVIRMMMHSAKEASESFTEFIDKVQVTDIATRSSCHEHSERMMSMVLESNIRAEKMMGAVNSTLDRTVLCMNDVMGRLEDTKKA